MKVSFLVGAAVGYVLGAKAGKERYEQIVRTSRRVAGSQTFQSTRGVVQAQIDQLGHHAKGMVGQALVNSSNKAKADARSARSNPAPVQRAS